MMNKNTYTQVSALSVVIAILDDVANDDFILLSSGEQIEATALREKIDGMRTTIANKKRTPSKVSAAKVAEHNAIMDSIMDVLVNAEGGMTVSEMQKASTALRELSTSKISAMLRKMIADGRVVKTVEKRKSIFFLALDNEGVEEEDSAE